MKARRDRYLLALTRRALLVVGGLGTILVSISVHASNLGFDAAGNLFVARGHSVFKYTPDGTKSAFATGLRMPLGLCFDGKGNLFVSDGAGNLFVVDFPVMAGSGGPILKFSPDGTSSTFANGLHGPDALAIDATGNVYVAEVTAADASSHAILKFSPNGTKSPFTSALGA